MAGDSTKHELLFEIYQLLVEVGKWHRRVRHWEQKLKRARRLRHITAFSYAVQIEQVRRSDKELMRCCIKLRCQYDILTLTY